jgi:preprotein translocase YajC subunit
MGNGNDVLFWGILIAAMVVFLFLPQWMNRRRQKKREQDLRVGDRVMTIGGFIGELTYIDFEANLARIRLAEGIEVSLLPGAISGKRESADAVDEVASTDTDSGEA